MIEISRFKSKRVKNRVVMMKTTHPVSERSSVSKSAKIKVY